MQYTAHPWHGIAAHPQSPNIVTAFVEIVSSDTVKYEIDKDSGFLKIDRPQLYSNVLPCLYGFIPRTYCNEGIAALASERCGKPILEGDKDPLDICILTEKNITYGNILVHAIPIGGITLIDKGEADDKIIAVLVNDQVYGKYTDIGQLPKAIMDRIRHYFLTYKTIPGDTIQCELSNNYDAASAQKTINTAIEDYNNSFK